jgi:hypothetical protein
VKKLWVELGNEKSDGLVFTGRSRDRLNLAVRFTARNGAKCRPSRERRFNRASNFNRRSRDGIFDSAFRALKRTAKFI